MLLLVRDSDGIVTVSIASATMATCSIAEIDICQQSCYVGISWRDNIPVVIWIPFAVETSLAYLIAQSVSTAASAFLKGRKVMLGQGIGLVVTDVQ